MVCTVCNHYLGSCQCADIDARLRAAAYDPGGAVLFKWCRTCDRHYARCQCEAPDFYLISAGQEISPADLRQFGGQRLVKEKRFGVDPDLLVRRQS